MTKKEKQEKKTEARQRLLEILKPGDTVQCILRTVSRSGMSRRIDFYTIKADGNEGIEKLFLTAFISRLLNYTYTVDDWGNKKGLRVDGCGMDMGFEVVYNIGRHLWPKGDGKFTINRNGDPRPETDGGYLLRHNWL